MDNLFKDEYFPCSFGQLITTRKAKNASSNNNHVKVVILINSSHSMQFLKFYNLIYSLFKWMRNEYEQMYENLKMWIKQNIMCYIGNVNISNL